MNWQRSVRLQAADAYPGFTPVRVKYSEWLNPALEHTGERILWNDGSAHGSPEDDGEFVTVLRRAHPAIVLPKPADQRHQCQHASQPNQTKALGRMHKAELHGECSADRVTSTPILTSAHPAVTKIVRFA